MKNRWSQDGRYLLSASRDWKCVLWDLSTGEPARIIQLNAPVYNVVLHPTELKFVAALYESDAVFVDMTKSDAATEALITKLPKNENEDKTLCVAIHPNGRYAFCATNRGEICIIDISTMELKYTGSCGRSAISNMVISSSGRKLLCNCGDKVIRLCELPDFEQRQEDNWNLEVIRKFEEKVNRPPWSSIALESSEEFVAATLKKGHGLVLWETQMSTLQQSYESPKEMLYGMEFHPQRCIIVAIGADTGRVYLFEPESKQRWSALAPDFVELEDNEEYSEKEDEFDMYDDDEVEAQQAEEDEHVDIITPLNNDDDQTSTFIVPIDLELSIEETGSDHEP